VTYYNIAYTLVCHTFYLLVGKNGVYHFTSISHHWSITV